jgi:hypothetical protein
MTAQIHETLYLDGEETSMVTCPDVPDRHPRVVFLSREQALEKGGRDVSYIFSTACWRRYRGTWKIEDGKFWLVALAGSFELTGEGPLLADWFSGVLNIPRGERIRYVHMGFESLYEENLLLTIEEGVVVSSRVIDNRDRV